MVSYLPSLRMHTSVQALPLLFLASLVSACRQYRTSLTCLIQEHEDDRQTRAKQKREIEHLQHWKFFLCKFASTAPITANYNHTTRGGRLLYQPTVSTLFSTHAI